MKRLVVLFVMLSSVALIRAQFDAQIGQYMFMQSSYNPAAVGESGLMRVYGSHRMDFTGVRNAPMTTVFSFSSPFVLGKTSHSAGVRFMNDRFGLFSNQSLYLDYAYRFKLGNGVMSVGLDAGFLNLSFAVDSVNLGGGKDEFHEENDQTIPVVSGSGNEKGASGMGFDMGLGVYYKTARWWAGLSYAHVTQPRLKWGDRTEFQVKGTMYLVGGYNWQLSNKDWMLLPSMMVETDFTAWDVNLTMLAQLKKRYRFGAGYRLGGSLNILMSMDVVSGLQLGYTYELPANALLKESYGSHEVYLSYGFDVLKPKHTNKSKSVRYL